MRDSLQSGISVTARIEVDDARAIDFMGEEARVYATPALVADIERTCRNLLLEHLDEGEDTVGTRVAINHTGITVMGMWVDITATATEVDGRKIALEISASDAFDEVCNGTHNRFVVEIEKLKQRITAKAAKAKE